MRDYQNRCWAVIDLDGIASNIAALKKNINPGCLFMAMIKADAYGHGDLQVALELARLGVDRFGVSCLDEAVYLRENGIQTPLLILGPTAPENTGVLIRNGFTQTVHSAKYAKALHEACRALGQKVSVHIKLDTGMSRLGFQWGAESEVLKAVSYRGLKPEGIFTHFACADETAEDSARYTKAQFDRFRGMLKKLEAGGALFKIKHCCNSAATMLHPEMHLNMVRPGIAVYGLYPSADCASAIELTPAMKLYSQITAIREIEAGTPVSYGRIFTAQKKTRIATVGIGYADGYPRALSNTGKMLVRGQFAPVAGRVCMDQLMLDVTHINGAAEGDVVTVVGEDGGNSVTFDELAAGSGTVNYERVCLVGKRVPRVYMRGGKAVSVRDYVNRG